jgi:2-isopropylmalate synthase
VPYLPIDPADVGRGYEAVIRINSQSGKGGMAYILERDHGLQPPRKLRVEFSETVQAITDREERELDAKEIWGVFERDYLACGTADSPWKLIEYTTSPSKPGSQQRTLTAVVEENGKHHHITGTGTGPIDAFTNALKSAFGIDLKVINYHEHAVSDGSDALAASYVEALVDGKGPLYGVGMDVNTSEANLHALLSAVNRSRRPRYS